VIRGVLRTNDIEQAANFVRDRGSEYTPNLPISRSTIIKGGTWVAAELLQGRISNKESFLKGRLTISTAGQ
jgi:hypothetical protein